MYSKAEDKLRNRAGCERLKMKAGALRCPTLVKLTRPLILRERTWRRTFLGKLDAQPQVRPTLQPLMVSQPPSLKARSKKFAMEGQ